MKILRLGTLLTAFYFFAASLYGWSEISVDDTLAISDIQFLNDTVGYLTIDVDENIWEDTTRMYKTIDGGNTWIKSCCLGWNHMNCLYFYNENFGFSAGDYFEMPDNPFNPNAVFGCVFKTEDGGAHWQGFVMVSSYETVKRICIMDSVICWTMSKKDICYKANIFGPYFIQIQYELTDGFFRDFHFTSASKGCAVGITNASSALYMWTTNGGADWNQDAVLTGNAPGLRGVFFVDDNTGWVVGHSGCIYRTTNNGQTWESQTSGVTVDLNALYFFDENIGWVVGDGGTILFTENGGADWTSQNSGTDRDLMTIFFLDSLRGWVGGDSGTVLCTENGGTAVEEEHVELTGSGFMISLISSNRYLNVSFHLNVDTRAEITVYNILGQEIFSVAQKKYSKGENSVEIDIADFPSGVYFTNFRTEYWKITKPFFVIE